MNKSYFLYDKSDLIKEAFITSIKKMYQFTVESTTLIKKQKTKYLK